MSLSSLLRMRRFTLISCLLLFVGFSFCKDVQGQTQSGSPMDSLLYCGVSPAFFASMGVDTNTNSNQGIQSGITPANTFPSNAIITCGHFKIYYQDLVIGSGGFADASSGAARRNTLCAVLNYVETLFDFSAMSSNEYIRLYVEQSYSNINTAPVGTGWYAEASPLLDATTSGVKNGWVYDFINSGNDPTTSNNYHAYLKVNFHGIYYGTNTTPTIIDYLNDYTGNIAFCQLDLYSVLLHEIGHTLGWFSLVKYTENTNNNTSGDANLSGVYTNNIYSGLDYSMYVGQVPTTGMPKLITGTLSSPNLNTSLSMPQANLIWLNGLLAPRNHPVFSGDDAPEQTWGSWIGPSIYNSYGSHLDDQLYVYPRRQRFSPGDITEPVMGPFALNGELRRTFNKAEIQGFKNLGNGSMGYNLNSGYSNLSTLINNRVPFCSKMSGSIYANLIPDIYFAENVAADFPILTNNTTSYIDIDVQTDSTISDLDGNPVQILASTITNYRGCDLNGNNHGCLTLINNHTIRFTPKPNFYGRAQFGFNLYDGYEKGGYVIYTIDVAPGNNGSYTAGTDNIILNGDFEQGSEVRRIGTEESILFTVLDKGMYDGKLKSTHYSDAHPYSYMTNLCTPIGAGSLIQNSFTNCPIPLIQPQNVDYRFGFFTCNAPYGSFNVTSMANNAGVRCQGIVPTGFMFFNLRANMQNCHKYRLQYHVYAPANAAAQFSLSFGNSNTITYPVMGTPYSPVTNFVINSTANLTAYTWQQITQDFWYCGNLSNSNIAFLYNTGSDNFVIDNFSIQEILNPPVIAATISQAPHTPCTVMLTANVTNQACSVTYQWKLNGVNIPGATASTYEVNPSNGGNYTVYVTDGCNSNTSNAISFTANVCTNCAVYNTNNITQLGNNGTITQADLTGGPYYITNTAVAISGTVDVTNEAIFMGPGVTINIPTTGRLRLNNAHLFGCDQLWNGIKFVSGSGSSGVLEMTNNTLIEDAITAVTLPFIAPINSNFTSSNRVLKSSGAMFNRNRTAIDIYNAQSSTVGSLVEINNTIVTSRNLTTNPLSWPTIAALKTYSLVSYYHLPYALTGYTVSACKDNSKAENGIKLTNVGTTTGTTTPVYNELQIGKSSTGNHVEVNIFDNLQYGIRAEASNFSAVNNSFSDILTPTNAAGGYGIYAKATAWTGVANNRARVYDTDPTKVLSNYFYNCTYAAYIWSYREIVGKNSYIAGRQSNTTTSNNLFGYRVMSGKYDKIDISDNQIYNMRTGISYLTDVYPGTQSYLQSPGLVYIARNKIAPDNPAGASNTTRYVELGLEMANSQVYAWLTNPGNIDVRNNVLTNVSNGIYAENIRYPSGYQSNNITLRQRTGLDQFGMYNSGCVKDWVYSNTITGFGLGSTIARGVLSNGNDAHHINCNFVASCNVGFEFRGTSATSQWRLNEMTNNGHSFVLNGAGATIGSQYGPGMPSNNKWLVATGFTYGFTNGHFQTLTRNNANPIGSKLYVFNNTINNPTINWSQPNNNPAYSSSTIITTSGPIWYYACPDKQVKDGDKTHTGGVITNQYGFANKQVLRNWIAQNALWNSIFDDSTLVDSFALLQEFHEMGHLSRYALLRTIDSNMTAGDTATVRSLINDPALLSPTYDSSCSGVVITDDSTVNPVIENYLKYYDLGLKYISGGMTGEDSSRVDSLAGLCPTLDGYAVFKARALYHLLYEDVRTFVDDCAEEIVEEEDSSMERSANQYPMQPLAQLSKGSQDYRVLPNPNNGNFTIEQSVRDERPVSAEVLNAVGAQVHKVKLVFKGSRADIRMGVAVPGSYVLKLNDAQGKYYTIKFTVL